MTLILRYPIMAFVKTSPKICLAFCSLLLVLPAAAASEIPGGEIITLWPLFDYRSSPSTGYSNLSILGPLFKREQRDGTTVTALRPLFFSSSSGNEANVDILYPLASGSADSESSDTQVLKLYQRHVAHSGTADEKSSTMLFPFYISGRSEKYGPYTSVFPFHGDIYERFWRDEYHFTLFPLYGRTVKNGTVSTNYLYPFFNVVSGQNESGFHVWPLYGQSRKEGVYEKRFALWPFFSSETRTDSSGTTTENINLLPFYASSRSPQRSSTHIPWPFTGVVRDSNDTVIERDILWPLWMTADGKDSHTERYLPFYAESRIGDTVSRWLMWPCYREETIDSRQFRQEKTSLFYFLFSRSEERWLDRGEIRGRSSLWPLYAWNRDEKGVRTLTLPAPVEPVIWNDGVERNWAPLWRIFIARWDDTGGSAVSLLWNLYWHERRGADLAWELSPLVSWRSDMSGSDFRLLKGLFGYEQGGGRTTLRLLWIPVSWGGT